MKTFILILFLLSSNIYASKFYYEYDKKVELEENTTKTRSSSEIQEYKNKDGKDIQFRNEIIVQCKKDINCEDNFTLLGVDNYTKLSKGFYLIFIQKGQNIFALSQKLYEHNSIKLAHPNFIKNKKRR